MDELRVLRDAAHAAKRDRGDLSADRRRTETNRRALAAGVHPATRERLTDPELELHCRDCVHAVRVGHHDRVWWKCEEHRLGMSRSAASDIRVSWPACVRVVPRAA
jgi:hypothetical protein